MVWELRMFANIDCFCSGTTAVTLVKQGQNLVIGNVVDSRAVLGSRDQNNSLVAVQLTVDLKPNLPEEAERIHKCKGRNFALQDEPEVARVWLPHSDSPGLAMARAFGDFFLKEFGIISVPEISNRCIIDKDEFVVLATDGIWDVLSNKEVVDIVGSCPTRSFAARRSVNSAVWAWRSKYPTSKVDDCAEVCLFLDSNFNNLSTASGRTEINRSGTVITGKVVLGEDSQEFKEASEENKEELSVSASASASASASDPGEIWMEGGKEWSGLEDVSRVNTILSLPRFMPNIEEKKVRK